MKKLIKLILLLISITCISSHAEPGKVGIGVTGGYLNASNDVKYVYSCYMTKFMENFNQGGYFTGIVLDYPLGLGLAGSIVTKLYYNNFSYHYMQRGDSYISFVNNGKDEPTPNQIETIVGWNGKYSLLSLDVLPKIKIPYINVGLFAGLSFSYLANSVYNENNMIGRPNYIQFKVDYTYIDKGYRYTDNNRTIIFKEGELPYKNNFRYAIKAGLNYDLHLGEFCISPFISMDFPLNDVVNGANTACPSDTNNIRTNLHWRITYYQFGIDLKYLF